MNIGIAEKISTTMRARLSLTLLLQKMKQSHSHCPRQPPIRKDHLFARVGYKNTPTKTFYKTRQHKPTRTASSRRHESSQDCRGLPAMRHPNRNTFHCHSSLACRASVNGSMAANARAAALSSNVAVNVVPFTSIFIVSVIVVMSLFSSLSSGEISVGFSFPCCGSSVQERKTAVTMTNNIVFTNRSINKHLQKSTLRKAIRLPRLDSFSHAQSVPVILAQTV